MANLFTTQTPDLTNNDDGAPGITTATTVRYTALGTITGIWFYATTTVSGTYTALLYRVDNEDAAPAGTLLASKTLAESPTPGAWNKIEFDPGDWVSTSLNTLYRGCVFSSAGRYVATLSFFLADLVNGVMIADARGDDPVGIGVIGQGTFRIDAAAGYPSTSPGPTCYFVAPDFVEASGDTSTFPAGISVPVALGAPTAVSTTPDASPAGLAVPVALGAPAVSSANDVSPAGIPVPVALGAPAAAVTTTAAPAGISSPVALGAPTVASTTAVSPAGLAVPVSLGAPTVAGAILAPAGLAVPVSLGRPEVTTPAAEAGGSWDGYLAVINSARQDAKLNEARRRNPVECPVDGWPLDRARGQLHCPFCGHIIVPSI